MIVDENGMCTLDNEDKSYHSNTPRKKTNADCIRAMSDEELAKWLSDMHDSVTCPNNGSVDCNPSCKKCWLDWLKQEVSNAELD